MLVSHEAGKVKQIGKRSARSRLVKQVFLHYKITNWPNNRTISHDICTLFARYLHSTLYRWTIWPSSVTTAKITTVADLNSIRNTPLVTYKYADRHLLWMLICEAPSVLHASLQELSSRPLSMPSTAPKDEKLSKEPLIRLVTHRKLRISFL